MCTLSRSSLRLSLICTVCRPTPQLAEEKKKAKARDRDTIARSKTGDHAKRLEKCWRYATNTLAKAEDDFASHVQKYREHLLALGVPEAELDASSDPGQKPEPERTLESDVFEEDGSTDEHGAGFMARSGSVRQRKSPRAGQMHTRRVKPFHPALCRSATQTSRSTIKQEI